MTTESIDPTQNCLKEAKAMSDNVRKKAEGAPGPHVSVLTPYRKRNDLVFFVKTEPVVWQVPVKKVPDALLSLLTGNQPTVNLDSPTVEDKTYVSPNYQKFPSPHY